jgi:hypothetical protein
MFITQKQRQDFIQRASPPFKTSGGLFQIYYLLRTPPKGRSNGLDGVDDFRLVSTYARALEDTYKHLRSARWHEPDRGPAADPITVVVHDTPYPHIAPAPTHPGGVYIGLRSELEETTYHDCLMRAEVDATHEVVHVFTARHRWRTDGYVEGGSWAWFDEATAVYFERLLNQGSHATLSNGYARLWVNQPETRLEWEKDGGHHGAWLLQYLVNRYGSRFLRDVWHEARLGETPCQVMDRIMQKRTSRRASLEQLLHNYAVRSHHTSGLDRMANRRYGDRKFAYVLPLDGLTGRPEEWKDDVEPLGCRYYLIGPVQAPRPMTVEVLVEDPRALGTLSASIHSDAPGNNGRAYLKHLKPNRAVVPPRLAVDLAVATPETEFVLVVSRCASSDHLSDTENAGLEYRVRVV